MLILGLSLMLGTSIAWAQGSPNRTPFEPASEVLENLIKAHLKALQEGDRDGLQVTIRPGAIFNDTMLVLGQGNLGPAEITAVSFRPGRGNGGMVLVEFDQEVTTRYPHDILATFDRMSQGLSNQGKAPEKSMVFRVGQGSGDEYRVMIEPMQAPPGGRNSRN